MFKVCFILYVYDRVCERAGAHARARMDGYFMRCTAFWQAVKGKLRYKRRVEYIHCQNIQ